MTFEPEKPKPRIWIRIIFILSLGLNLAIAGFVIGISIKGPPQRATPQNRDAVAFLSYALPDKYRREIRRELVDRQAELRANRDALRGLRLEMIRILQQEPFEVERVELLLERQRAHFLSLGELAHDALIRRIAKLTPQERESYVRSLQQDARAGRRSN